jgi:membrane protease subunit (stomatin/prohibitin family)
MSVFKFIKNQLIEVIEWTDNSSSTMVYRFPVQNKEIKMGAQLTVRESQAAIFINEGQIADVYPPGRYELTTQNMPLLTKLKSWKYGFNSPFKAEVYFVNTKQFPDQKWGTPNPVLMRDADFGKVRVRAHGNFSFKISDPALFLREVFGTNGVFDSENIVGQLRRSIVSSFADVLGEARMSVMDLLAYYTEFGELTLTKLQPKFNSMGLMITLLEVVNITVPEEVEKAIDKRSTMGAIGDVNLYTKFQAADALRDAAKNPNGGMAGAGIGLGAGVTLGSVMGDALRTSFSAPTQPQQHPQPQPGVAPTNTIACPSCNARVSESAKFCPECGKPTAPPKVKCIKCSFEMNQNMKFCPECGSPQNTEIICKKCGQKVPSGSKFCPECGEKTE